MASGSSKHLDLGCGDAPRNPFLASEVYGVDIERFPTRTGYESAIIVEANLLERLPFEDGSFSSVSAYDVLEHIPRCSVHGSGPVTFPFIELMNEVWRILEPRGTFVASIPAFPHPRAFQDPTHVNFITDETHLYFTGSDPYASRYGFNGFFELVFADWDAPKNAQEPMQASIRKTIRNLEHRLHRGGLSHVTWIFKATK
jgi:SAM-dependent methyltransferase